MPESLFHLPLPAAGLQGLRGEYARTIEPARSLAIEALKLECALSDLVNQAYGLTPAEIALLWATAPPRMPIPYPSNGLRTPQPFTPIATCV
jgi:hypothetical protein